ncbi:GH3 auxin-responsive promoter family protein [Desulfosediminicola ganghwensis]|uniref:GH3 auxin-responsive promoter family protein n=1 Tax=Desulfosediminicola ganghwensis TaxID=2569540 RepID=UPI0010ABCB76|nr:GH3 auxin-responsive promoter family protein [Desulfosediminicola ganghwensis]
MSIASFLIGLTIKRSAQRFEQATAQPMVMQENKLFSILTRNANTEYGKRYGFSSIKTIEEYQKQVPVMTYEDIKHDMQRIIVGTKNILTAEDPVMFAQTSGTTGDPKYIPVTPSCQGQETSDQMRAWTYHCKKDHPDILEKKVLSLVSPAVEGHTPSGMPYGSTSGLIYKNMPALIRSTYSIPYDVFEIEDYGAKYFSIMRISLEHDIRFLVTANPSSVIKMCEKANSHSEEIIRDIHDGTLSASFPIGAALFESISKRLKPNPNRAKELATLRDLRNGELRPADYWPQLSLIGCWKGGSVGHYLNRFPHWFNPEGGKEIPVRDIGYLSSEARGSIPLSDEGSAGVLTVATNFVEFVEVENLESNRNNPQAWNFLTLKDVEIDREYYIFFTTTAGLYRYDINDVIKVVGYYNETPQIIFLRKGRGMTNITGEKVSVNQIISSFQKASEATGISVDHFKAEADHKNSRYIFRVEFTTRVQPELEQQFIRQLDNQLKSVNIEYKAKRDSQRLDTPLMHVMREGWYERNRKRMVEGGMRAFQAKTELLSPNVLATQQIKPELERIVEIEQ